MRARRVVASVGVAVGIGLGALTGAAAEASEGAAPQVTAQPAACSQITSRPGDTFSQYSASFGINVYKLLYDNSNWFHGGPDDLVPPGNRVYICP
ncbi:hypothetical protein [Streptomyces sp. NPDC016675]|jgi:hypothetical protein|uniref:hypothetical protein n=1 Tax=Streptomyces sp. NPDC016675 TaxID=3364970 RepID=UPI0036FE8EE3